MFQRSTKDIKTILARYHVSPKQSLGQHFLVNDQIIQQLVKSAQINENDIVLEIGMGFGAVTIPLAHKSKYIYSVEIEPTLIHSFRRENPQLMDRVIPVPHDILTLNVANLFEQRDFTSAKYHVVGAIPYNITSPIVHKFLTEHPLPHDITLLIQKEVAEKMVAQPPNASYLSNFVKFLGEGKISKNNVPPSAFFPPPRVLSAVIRIDVAPKYPDISPAAFSDFLHTGFQHP
ncbi:ribosomal RNA small subunit methyltransferase A, partial [candidate division WWE3 bacterium]|nr:ribosomal RNA small subunit methyltransferase A [candidate division WWE3 bacterium]